MADEIFENKLGTVGFTAKRNRGQYQSDEVSIYLPFEFTTDGTELDLRIRNAFAEAKSQVYEQIGAEATIDVNGVVSEAAQATADAFGGEVVHPANRASLDAAAPRNSGGSGFKVWKRILDPDRVGDVDERGNPIKLANPPWFAAQVAKANERNGTNETEFWDNRGNLPQYGGTGSPKAAWFVGKENREVKVWPPN